MKYEDNQVTLKGAISIEDAVQYEVASSILGSFIGSAWMQGLLSGWLVRKAKRKHNRYVRFIQESKRRHS